jgi:hypothetical protein
MAFKTHTHTQIPQKVDYVMGEGIASLSDKVESHLKLVISSVIRMKEY